MLAAAAGERAPSWRHLAVFGFEFFEALVAAVARVDIDNYQPGAFHTEIGLRCPLPPELDLPRLSRGIQQPARHKQAVGMLRRFFARRHAAEFAAARTDRSAAMFDRPIRRKDRVPTARKGECGRE